MRQVVDYNGQKLDLEWGLDELMRLDCEESLSKFVQHAWRFMDPAPFVHGWVVDAICEHLEAVCDGEIRRLLINVPPRCLKSSLCSVAFPAWVWAQEHESPTSGPRVPFLHASYGYNLSLRDSVKCRRLIKSTWYRRLWGNRFQITKEQDQKIRFRNSKDGERLITSIGSGVTGEGGNIIIVDDPNAADEVLSDAVIKTTNEDWWDGTMGTRLNDPKTGAFIVIQQRLGEEDLSGHILDKEGDDWVHLMLPMEYEPSRAMEIYPTTIDWSDPRTEEGELLWPERFGPPEIKALTKRLGSWKAAGQLQQRPEPQGGGIIKRDDWQVWPPGGERQGQIAQYPPCSFVLASLDTAFTAETMNDQCAMTVWGVFGGDAMSDLMAHNVRVTQTETARVFTRTIAEASVRIILLMAWSENLEFNALLKKAAKTCYEFKVDKLIIENKANGISVGQEMRRLMSEETIIDPDLRKSFSGSGYSVQLVDPKQVDKVARLYSVQHIFEDKMVYAPNRPWAELVIAQCGTFPNSKRKDLVDTTSQALRHLRDLGLLERGAEVTAALTEELRHKGRADRPLYPGSR